MTMAAGKITLTFNDGKKRVLKRADEFRNIDKTKIVYLVYGVQQVYKVHTDGTVDEHGNIQYENPCKVFDVNLPISELIGWAYE